MLSIDNPCAASGLAGSKGKYNIINKIDISKIRSGGNYIPLVRHIASRKLFL